jgi:hypothetical protein
MRRSLAARLSRMDRTEAWFRVASATRRSAGRLKTAVRRPAWNRQDLVRAIGPEAFTGDWGGATDALRRHDIPAAHRAIARHFASESSVFPIDARDLPDVAAAVAVAFPDADAHARARAGAILDGRYDLLGYRHIAIPRPIDWHRDHVSGRRAPTAYWSDVAYLDPAFGDHKVTWELNRHQHWLALARAYALTQDRRYYAEFVDQLEGWLAANPPLIGVNWASMLELAFRTLSWLWALVFFSSAATTDEDPRPWTVDLVLALDRQLTHVEHNLSRYFSPNTHLTGEALALYVAGHALPQLRASRRRVALGRRILLHEAERQILGDGGHAELSGHYQRYSTDFYLLASTVARRSGDAATSTFALAARKQARFLRAICDDSGLRPPIGDDDGGQLFPICGRDAADCRDTLAIAALVLDEPALALGPAPEEAFWMCGIAARTLRPNRPAPRGFTPLPDSGYFVSSPGAGDLLVFDAGPHGYLNGGHAHADALSVIVTAGGRPLLIDPGTATYTMDAGLRDRFRSSAMHNTVVLDHQPQSVPDGPFHWARRASASAPIWRSTAGCDYVEGTHDGYLPRRHARGVLAIHGMGWWILDHLIGAGPAHAEVYWHLHPAWVVASEADCAVTLRDGRDAASITSSEQVAVLPPGRHDLARYSPAYGVVEPAPVLCARADVELPATIATFIDARGTSQALVVERVPVVQSPGDAWHAAGFRARWNGGRMTVLAAVERTGVASGPAAAPPGKWGTADLTTDARVGVILEHDGVIEGLLVNGTSLEPTVPGPPFLALPQPAPIARIRLVAPTAATA